MKHAEPHDEIAALLRTRQPELRPSPGLEARILRELDRRQHRKPAWSWPWFVLPPAFAALALLTISGINIALEKQRALMSQAPVVVAPKQEPTESSLIGAKNPLKEETAALGRDARRAGRFLIDCLPFAQKEE